MPRAGMGPELEELVLENSKHSLVINEAMLVLAEKRTSLSLLRTGIAVVAVPLSIISFLIATSGFYELHLTLYLLAPVWAACIVLFALGMHMILRSLVRIRAFDLRIEEIKLQDRTVGALIEVD